MSWNSTVLSHLLAKQCVSYADRSLHSFSVFMCVKHVRKRQRRSLERSKSGWGSRVRVELKMQKQEVDDTFIPVVN